MLVVDAYDLLECPLCFLTSLIDEHSVLLLQPEMAQVKDILHRSVEEVASSGLLPSGDVERLKRCLERNFRAYTYLE